MSDNEDPIVLYLIVRDSLNMSAGKGMAQSGHAVEKILLKYFKIQILSVKKYLNLFTDEDVMHVKIATEWMEHGSRKVVLKADEKEWAKLKEEFGNNCFIVKDAGKTEVMPGTETIMALWPQRRSTCSKTIKRLPPQN